MTTVNTVKMNVKKLNPCGVDVRYASAEPNNVGTKLADSDHGLNASRYVLSFMKTATEHEAVPFGDADAAADVAVDSWLWLVIVDLPFWLWRDAIVENVELFVIWKLFVFLSLKRVSLSSYKKGMSKPSPFGPELDILVFCIFFFEFYRTFIVIQRV